VRRYTPQQVNLFVSLAEDRLARETIANATASAIGAAVGWSGKWDLLKKFASKIQAGRNSGPGGDAGTTLRDRLRALLPQGGPGRRKTRE